jgi:hypothetical protein
VAGRFGDPVPLFGPLPGLRDGDVVAYEFALPARFEPWPGRSRLDQGVIMPPNSRSNGLNAVSCHTPFTCVAIGSSEAKTGSAMTLVAEHES